MDQFQEFRKRLAVADDRLFLGYLSWYTLSDVSIAHSECVRLMGNAGIATRLPSPPKDQDVFERISTLAQRKKVPTSNPDVFENLLIRNVGRDEHEVQRNVVVEQVNPSGRRISHEQIAVIKYKKATSLIETSWTPAATMAANIAGKSAIEMYPQVQDMLDQMILDYNKEKGHLTSYHVREWIRKFVLSLGATAVRPGGGVYFVMPDRHDDLLALETFVNSLPGDCSFHLLPLVDDRRQREMLREAFEAEASSEIDVMLAEMQEVFEKADERADYKITEKRYLDYLNRYQELHEKSEEYEQLLEAGLATTQSRLSVFQQTMIKLRAHVKQ